ncbi:hypothetical protein ANDA3_2482 [plant metagenome]|uniref:AurF domain containing protein n=1 Tax=plant metagenome TaxID=1297885 RepID=A0A484UMH8_9ZZZZ
MPDLEKLIRLSKERQYDVYTRFDWPERVAEDRLWCDESLLTTYGTDLHGTLSEQQLIALSKWEAINFYSLNVHGIKDALEFVCRKMYARRYADYTEYMHIFLAEENAHMWFFARFCQDYGGKIYKTLAYKEDQAGTPPLLDDLYMFSSTLIFEEFVDYYNRKVGENASVPDIVREINLQHHLDESRHVKFGRDIIKDVLTSIRDEAEDWPETQSRIDATIRRIFLHFVGLMYNPHAYADAGVYLSPDAPSAAQTRNYLRNAPQRRPHHEQWFKRTARYFESIGAISDSNFL